MSTLIEIYKPEHAYDILERNVRDIDLQLSQYLNWEEQCKLFAEHPAYTLFVNGDVVACGGVVLMGFDRGEAWTLFSILISRYPKAVIKATKSCLKNIVSEQNLKRVQALVNPKYTKGHRFLSFLGFQKEGLLRFYGPNGENMTLYSRIF